MGSAIPILSILFVIVVSAISAALGFVRKNRGAPSLSEPRCAKCDYDLRGFSGTAPVRCSECGADLGPKNAVLWGRYQQKTRNIWIIIASGFFPLVVFFIVFYGLQFSLRRAFVAAPTAAWKPVAPTPRTNAAVINSLISASNMYMDWPELQKRMAAGTLSNAEVRQAIDHLITFLNNQPNCQPLSMSFAGPFITQADSGGKITDEQYQRFAKAFYHSCNVSIVGKIRPDKKLLVVVTDGMYEIAGEDLVCALRQVTCGDKKLRIISIREKSDNADYFSAKAQPYADFAKNLTLSSVACFVVIPSSMDTCLLTFTVDVAVLRSKTAPHIIGELPGQAVHWPKPRATWTDVITLPFGDVTAASTTQPG